MDVANSESIGKAGAQVDGRYGLGLLMVIRAVPEIILREGGAATFVGPRHPQDSIHLNYPSGHI